MDLFEHYRDISHSYLDCFLHQLRKLILGHHTEWDDGIRFNPSDPASQRSRSRFGEFLGAQFASQTAYLQLLFPQVLAKKFSEQLQDTSWNYVTKPVAQMPGASRYAILAISNSTLGLADNPEFPIHGSDWCPSSEYSHHLFLVVNIIYPPTIKYGNGNGNFNT